MKTLMISCKIFKPILEQYNLKKFDILYLEIAQHEYPEQLKSSIQEAIDQNGSYETIILLYGLCGNATDGIVNTFSERLIIPRFHDCFGMMIGSYEKMREITGNNFSFSYDTQEYCKKDLSDDFDYYLEKYGEEEANYLMEAYRTDKKAYYIQYPFEKEIPHKKNYDQILKGSYELFDQIFQEDWISEKFIIIKKNQRLVSAYDLKSVFTIQK